MANPSIRLLSFLFKSKDWVSFNGLVTLVTMSGQELFSLFAFHCPCTPGFNYQYWQIITGGPILVFFFISIFLNKQTRNLVAECKNCWNKNFSVTTMIFLLNSIVLRALVAPVTWLVITLLRGEAYVCAYSEFVDPSSLMARDESFPLSHATQILAKFPCREGPANLSDFQEEVNIRLKSESQLLGCLFIGLMAFQFKIFYHCCTKLNYRQEAYLTSYLANEERLFQQTAEVHSLVLAANNVKRFFGFVLLNKEDEELVAKFPEKGTHLKLPWDNITGSYLFQKSQCLPLYSRLHEWAQGPRGKARVIDMEMADRLPHPEPHLAASLTPNP